jgi:hypothetical protein
VKTDFFPVGNCSVKVSCGFLNADNTNGIVVIEFYNIVDGEPHLANSAMLDSSTARVVADELVQGANFISLQ